MTLIDCILHTEHITGEGSIAIIAVTIKGVKALAMIAETLTVLAHSEVASCTVLIHSSGLDTVMGIFDEHQVYIHIL